ncbi:MAG: ABC transporter substrate-binding protein [Promethearchaeota archaeon]
MKKQQIACLVLAAFLVLPVAGVPVVAQMDVTPELSFPLWTLSWDDISVATGTGIKVLLDEIGINVDVEIKDDDPMYEGIYQEPRIFQMYEMSEGFFPFPDRLWSFCHSENIVDWGTNPFGLSNATFDAAIEDFLGATPSEVAEKARVIQVMAKENIAYVPLYLSDDTHAIRKEWTNYTLKNGGIFTSFNPQTMIFMYNTSNVRVDTGLTKTFIMAFPSDIAELNPFFWRSERSHWYDMLVYDTLISYDLGLNPIPWLAESYAISSDGMQVNFTLRSGAKWHDDTDVTPEDVKFSFEYMRDGPEDGVAWTFMQHVTDVTIDGMVISVDIDQPWAAALNELGEMYILPKHIREGIPSDDARWDDPTNFTAQIGSGPFMYSARVPDEYTTVVRNDQWWGPDNPYVGQLPNIEAVRIDVVQGQDARILAMRSGAADTERYEVFGAYVNTILNAPELDLVTGLPSQWDYYIGFNLTIPGLDEIAVRRAIAYAMDREYLVQVGRLGFGTITNNTMPATFYPGYYNPDGDWPDSETDMANQILDDAGYLDIDNDGIREFPGASLPEPGPDLLLIAGIGAGALLVGVIVTYVFLKRK